MNMLNPNYIVGLVDGEGSFTVYIRNPKESKVKKRRVRAEPKFYLKLVARDKKALYSLREFFGCGSVYFQKDKRANHQDCYRYEVVNRNDIKKIIIPFFQKYQLHLPSKIKDFKIFRMITKRIEKGDHLTTSGLRALYTLKQKMH